MADQDDQDDADKKLEARISAAVVGATKALKKELLDLKAKMSEPREPVAPPPTTEAGEPIDYAKSLKEASVRIASLEAESKAEKTANAELKAKQKRDRERGALTELAREHGISEPLTKAFVAMHHSEGSGLTSDDAEVFFEREGERVPVKKWAGDYFKSDEGKAFLPPKQAAGAGLRSANGAASSPEGERSSAELGQALLDRWDPAG